MLMQATFLLLTLILPTPLLASNANTPDIVIVGAGTAGCVLASRLCTSLPRAKIILLERASPRGPKAEFVIRSPRNAWEAWRSSLVSEIFDSEPNPGLNGRTLDVVTGDTLGGSSAMNGLQWTIPLQGTFESWRIAGLNTRVARRFSRRALRVIRAAVQDPPLKQIYARDIIEASVKAGIPETDRPFTGRSRDEVWENRVAVDRKGRRVDAATAYLQPVLAGKCRKNLQLIQGATVTKLIIKGKGRRKRVVGVQYVSSSEAQKRKKTTLAKQEVIVSAGPYGSPKLLQLSGIGPRDVLNAAGVRMKVDLGVGNKTQGRPLSPFTSAYTDAPIEPSNDLSLIKDPTSREQFEAGDGGVFGTAVGAINGRLTNKAYFTFGTNFDDGQGLGERLILGACFGNVDSFGYLRIKNRDPFSKPDVNLNFLGKEVDVKRLLECIRRMRDIHAALPTSLGVSEVTPTNDTLLNKKLLKDNAANAYHFVGGCAVGRVVEPNLLVRGVHGLRIVDASVFRSMPRSSGPLAATYTLAEYVSEKLSKKYRCKLMRARCRLGKIESRGW